MAECLCECKKCHARAKDCIWNPGTCSCQNEKYLASIMDDSAITCDETTKKKIISNKFWWKKLSYKMKISIFYLPFY